MKQTDEPLPVGSHRPPKTFHATVLPHVMKHVEVGTYRVKGEQPQFEVSCKTKADEDNLTYHPAELVDIKTMRYELVFNCQNFGATPIEITITWVSGQEPRATSKSSTSYY